MDLPHSYGIPQQPGQEPREPRSEPLGYADLALLVLAAAISGLGLLIAFSVAFSVVRTVTGAEFRADESSFAQLALALLMQGIWWALIFGAMFYIVTVRRGHDFFAAIGWRGFRPPALNFFSLGIVMAFSVGALSQVIPMPDEKLPIEEFLSSREAVIAMAFFGVLIAPLAEETVFRGFLFPILERKHGVAVAVAGTAAVFSALHAQQYGYHWQILLILFLVGTALGLIRARTGSVIASTITHASYNAALFAALLFIDEEAMRELERAAVWLR